ncbi:MAG TPA: carbamoyl-phosphate synthase (glutamine-hydrolyzing) small subunit, partial [Bacteroides sp.]|nr:carbamoyl-phosphate synthase (glutamine-hydrolyzing) small subunit [Bacteroides sp.]
GQILVLTYPIVGNYGVPREDSENELYKFFESDKLHISALVISDYSWEYSHWNAGRSLGDWLKQNRIPGIFDVDTRMITKLLREKGSMLGKVVFDEREPDFYDPNQENLVAKVSTNERKVYGSGRYRILLLDCGVKYNIIRYLLQRDTTVIRVPWDHDISKETYDGMFISNGPGDPKRCTATIRTLSCCFESDKPIFGICLGNQLMGLAAGADTYKLKYGHRSHNQPVLEVGTDKAYITSQNHGYAIDNKTLPEGWEPLFMNLNDNTNEGMRHVEKPFFSTQFHPEASGGPTDTAFLFDLFLENIKASL